MFRKIILLVSLSGFLAGCALQGGSSVPTPYPADYLPTVIYLTARSIHATSAIQTAAAVTPTLTPTVTPSPIPPTPTATDTSTPPPGMSLGAIQITSPGPMSKVGSPLEVRMSVVAVKNTKVYIALYGEDGSLLDDELVNIPNVSSGAYVFVKFPFEIRTAAEIGILQVTTRDGTGVLMALNTVRVLLLSSGVSQINPAGNGIYERVALETPAFQSVVSGGALTVKGTYLPFNLQQLVLELVNLNGKSLNAGRPLSVNGLDSQSINTTLSYRVDAPTQAYLVIHQQDDTLKNPVFFSNQYPIPWLGPAYVYTQLITLSP
jgi:hypothetical protein